MRWWWLKHRGARLRGFTVGVGPPVLLLHGGRDNARCWYAQVPAFAQHHRLIAFDARCHGSTRVANGDYSLLANVSDALGVLDAHEVARAAVVGYSMGAGTAVRLALASPDRVAALVLIGFGGNAEVARPEDVPGLRRAWDADQQLLREQGLEAMVPRRLRRVFSPQLPEREAKRYRRAFLRSSALELCRRPLPDLGVLDLGAVRPPTLVVAGEADAVFSPALGLAAANEIPAARFLTIPGGHACHLESPDVFNEAALAFLASVAPW